MGLVARTLRTALAVAVAVTVSAVDGGVARASTPNAIYVYPSRVDLLPDEASATQVVIHGAFFFWMKDFSYGAPACGYMYFQCPAGSEAMCRMQWKDIKNTIGGTTCAGFGPQQMTTTATLRAPGTPLAKPDTWDLGIGVSQGVWVDGKCDAAKQLGCKAPPPPDMAMVADLAVSKDLAMSADLAVSKDLAMTPDLVVIRDLAVAADLAMSRDLAMAKDLVAAPVDLAMSPVVDLAAAPSADLGAPVTPSDTCAIAPRSAGGGIGVGALAATALVALLLRRRRR